jgi:type I restriction enzyme S subunit
MSPLVKLAQLVEPVDTWNPALDNPDQEFKYVDIAAVDREEKVITSVSSVVGAEAPSRARQLLRSGDVIVSTVRPNLNAVAFVPPSLNGVTASTGFCVLRAGPSLDSRYLYHWVRTPRFVTSLVRYATGASYPAVSDAIIKASNIPLPSADEQRRIAAILDQTDTLRGQRQAALEELDAMEQSIFLEMFGDPVVNPKQWPDPKLGGLLTFQQYGPRFYNESYSEDGIRIVRITDLDDTGSLDFAEMPRLTVSAEDREKYVLRPKDLIFARSGATVGKVALIEPDDPPCIAGAYFITMRFADALDPVYARAVLMTPSIRAIVGKRSRQAAQQNFSGPGLRQLPMPLPPVECQGRFASCVAALNKLRAKNRYSMSTLNRLFESLLYRAFHGEL